MDETADDRTTRRSVLVSLAANAIETVALGAATWATGSVALKAQTADHGNKLSEIGKDIHAAKTTLKIVGAIIAALLAFAGWVGNKAVDAFVQSLPAVPALEGPLVC